MDLYSIKYLEIEIKIYSSPSNTNLCYSLKFPIPIMHRQFLRTLSENPEYVKTHCKN